jgi:hypothetical protein
MTARSKESIVYRNGWISQCVDGMSSMKLKNYDVKSDEKYISSTYF